MASEWTDPEELGGEEDDDPGILGGGGPAATIGEGADEELDEHGDNLHRADDEEL